MYVFTPFFLHYLAHQHYLKSQRGGACTKQSPTWAKPLKMSRILAYVYCSQSRPLLSAHISTLPVILFRSITMLCGVDNIPWHILEYFVKYCQPRITLLWTWIMVCLGPPPYKWININLKVMCGSWPIIGVMYQTSCGARELAQGHLPTLLALFYSFCF